MKLDPEFVNLAVEGVAMVTQIEDTQVVYTVIVGGGVHDGDRSGCRVAWRKAVTFGRTDRTVAGGMAFREAAREQEDVAFSYARAAKGVGQ
jgi:hypothetical protein